MGSGSPSSLGMSKLGQVVDHRICNLSVTDITDATVFVNWKSGLCNIRDRSFLLPSAKLAHYISRTERVSKRFASLLRSCLSNVGHVTDMTLLCLVARENHVSDITSGLKWYKLQQRTRSFLKLRRAVQD